MTMREALHIPEDDLIQYVLGTLPEIQLGTLTAHLSLCARCREELSETYSAFAGYSASTPETEIPQGARERFLASLVEAPAESKLVQMRNQSQLYTASKSFKTWLESPMPLKIFSGALAAGLLFAVYDDVSHIHQIRQLLPEMKRFEAETAELTDLKDFLRGSNAQEVSLHEKPALTKAPEGHALYSATSGKLVFTASNMPAPPPGKAYELWVLPVGTGAPVPAGMFTPDMQGNAAIIFPTLPANVQAKAFGVTVEDAAGSLAPTSAIILSGE